MVLAVLVFCALAAAGIAFLLVEFGTLVAAGALLALFFVVWMVRDVEVAYLGVIGVVTLLPFASFPIDIGFTPTLLDAALGALFGIWLLQLALHHRRKIIVTPLGLPIAIFMALAVGSFVAGLGHAPLTAYLLRHFGEVLMSVALFFVVVNTIRDAERLERVVRMLIICAFGAAVIGIALYLLATRFSTDLAIRILSALGRLGYPTGPGVLRYIEDNPELSLRATSTSVDPNVLGSLLNLALCISMPHLFSKRPCIRRLYLVPMVAAMALCLGLTLSRGALVGTIVGLSVIAVLKYRKLGVLMAGAALLLLLLPQTQAYVGHLISGFRVEDLATQMRFGEYKDAAILIKRYPWFGVGFAGSPDIDTYIGVSNVYLLIAQQMGIVGLTGFLLIVALWLVHAWLARRVASSNPAIRPIWWGTHAGIIGALVAGIVDHYVFNLDFHHSVTLFWLVLGLTATATEIAKRRQAP
jgi:O-antigen ligase